MVEINEEMKKIIEENPMAVATVDGNNNPYTIAVAFVKVKMPDKLIITDNYMMKTTENISKNPNLSIVVWDKEMNGYRFNGRAERFTSGEYFDIIKTIKENEGEPCKAAIVVTVENIKKLS